MDCQYSRAIKTKESLESQSLEKKLCLFHVAVYGPYAAKMMLNAKKKFQASRLQRLFSFVQSNILANCIQSFSFLLIFYTSKSNAPGLQTTQRCSIRCHLAVKHRGYHIIEVRSQVRSGLDYIYIIERICLLFLWTIKPFL